MTEFAEKAHDTTITGFLTGIIPDTFLSALTEGNILQVLFVAILFGIGLAMIGERGERITAALEELSTAGVQGRRHRHEGRPDRRVRRDGLHHRKYGVGTLANLAMLVGTFYLTALLFVIVVLGVVARLCGFSIFRLISYLKTELLLVLGTSSSKARCPP